MTETLCTCGKRPKHKCCEENDHRSDKMCLKGVKSNINLENLVGNYIRSEDEIFVKPVGAEVIQDFINSQEELGHEFEKILADNLSDLYLE